MFCRNCGCREGADGADPRLNHATWLCPDCARLSAVGYHFNPATGEVHNGISHDTSQALLSQRFRAMIRDEIRAALAPPPAAGMVDVRQYRRVELRDEDGTAWRGMLYKVEKEHL